MPVQCPEHFWLPVISEEEERKASDKAWKEGKLYPFYHVAWCGLCGALKRNVSGEVFISTPRLHEKALIVQLEEE